MARVLTKDGVLILSAPFQFRLHEQPHDYFRYSPHGLRELCAPQASRSSSRRAGELVERHRPQAQQLPRAPRRAHRGARSGDGQAVTKAAPSGSAGGRCLRRTVVSDFGGSARDGSWAADPEETLGFLVLARRAQGLEPDITCEPDVHTLADPIH